MNRFKYGWLPLLPLFVSFFANPAMAAPVLANAENRDFYFTYTEPVVFKVRAYAVQHQIDSMLWLYTSDGVLVAENDDFYGLDSWIEVEVPAGIYRLRAGVCCGNPDAWYGNEYELDFNTTPTITTTTFPETTTTSSTTTTTSTSTTTTTAIPTTTSTIPETTTTVEEVQPSTSVETTTTWPEDTTTVAPVTTTTFPAVPATTVPVETTVPVVSVPVATTSSTSTTSTTSTTTTDVPQTSTSTVSTTSSTTIPKSTPAQDAEVTTEEIINNLIDIETMSDEEVTNILQEIAGADLTDEEAALIAEVISQASPEVKREFEDTVNVFNGQFDTYIPLNSLVNVGTRRTLVAVGAATMTIAAPSPSRRRK